MSTLRKTSTYELRVRAMHPGDAVEEMKHRCSTPLAASGTDGPEAFIRFRASDDVAARVLARKCWSGPFRLSTGYGVNRREV